MIYWDLVGFFFIFIQSYFTQEGCYLVGEFALSLMFHVRNVVNPLLELRHTLLFLLTITKDTWERSECTGPKWCEYNQDIDNSLRHVNNYTTSIHLGTFLIMTKLIKGLTQSRQLKSNSVEKAKLISWGQIN